MSKESKESHAQPPIKPTGLKQKDLPSKGVGLAAIGSSLNQMRKYMKTKDALALSLKLNQKDGFDCPGCAWPDPDDDRSKIAEYCENGIKAIAEEATKKRLTKEYFQKNSVVDISKLSNFHIGKLGRLTEPMLLREGSEHYEEITWFDAMEIIASELKNLESPNDAIFYTSGRTSNEAAFLYQLMVRVFGTNNLPDCSNMCHESSGKGLSETVGIGKGSVTLPDLHEAELIIVMGQNPGTNHPRMLSALEKCKENGGQIISVNPLPEVGLMNFVDPQSPLKILQGGTKLTDLFLQVKVNEDIALLKVIMLLLLEKEAESPGKILDKDFIKNKTLDYEAFIEDLKKHPIAELIDRTGIDRSKIEAAVEMIATKKKIIICWAMGLTQHVNGVDNIREVVNLLLMKGAIGKPGAGTCPVRGHSNVQGDRTVGVWDVAEEAFMDRLRDHFDFEPPRDNGYSVIDAIKAMHDKPGHVFFAMGGNFISASPDTEYTAKGLRNCQLTVHVSTKLNRSHLVHGKRALILPCLGRTEKDIQEEGEQFVSVENSMGVVHNSKGIIEPCSTGLRSESWIIAKLAHTLFGDENIDWMKMVANYDNIRDAIEATVPGFENYNERVREPAGFYLPNGARDGKFNTPSGKAHFTINKNHEEEVPADHYIMMTIRSHDQYNTTIYGLDDRYRGIFNERRIVMMNKQDMHREGFKAKDKVDLIGTFKGVERIAKQFIVVPYDIPSGNVATYFPEANVLVPIDSFARSAKTPASKRVVIRIKM